MWVSFYTELSSSVRKLCPQRWGRIQSCFVLEKSWCARRTGRLEILKQGEMCFFLNAQTIFSAKQNSLTFPHCNSDGYHLMLCYDEGALIAKISFVGSQGHLLPSPRLQYLCLQCLRALLIIILISVIFNCLQSTLTHISECAFCMTT